MSAAAYFTPELISELRKHKDDDDSDWEFWGALDAIEELQAALNLRRIPLSDRVRRRESDDEPEWRDDIRSIGDPEEVWYPD